jgi:hypothetical protein
MEHLHREFQLKEGDTIEVTLSGNAANVLVLDDSNYQNYLHGKRYDYYGGYARTTPYRIQPPHPGRWHLVIDLGGGAGSVQASGHVVSASMS